MTQRDDNKVTKGNIYKHSSIFGNITLKQTTTIVDINPDTGTDITPRTSASSEVGFRNSKIDYKKSFNLKGYKVPLGS